MWGLIAAILSAIVRWRQKDPEVGRLETMIKEQKDDAKELVKAPRDKSCVVAAFRLHTRDADGE